jgi:L-fuconolactonase
MMIVDSQVHVRPADRPDRPLIRDGRENSPYRYEQLVADMDRAGIDCAVLVPPSIEGNRNDYALEAAQAYPGRFAVMGRFPLKTDESRNLIAGWRKQPGMLGMWLTSTATPTGRGSPTAPPTGSGRRPNGTTFR